MAGGGGEPAEFVQWFGEYTSTPKYPEVDWRPEMPVDAEVVRALVADAVPLQRNPASRFCFVRSGDGVVLFADGVGSDCSGARASFAERLCAVTRLTLDPAVPDMVIELVTELVNQGCLAFDLGD
jgi:50S ribosomal protein L16 3-hydroxylase